MRSSPIRVMGRYSNQAVMSALPAPERSTKSSITAAVAGVRSRLVAAFHWSRPRLSLQGKVYARRPTRRSSIVSAKMEFMLAPADFVRRGAGRSEQWIKRRTDRAELAHGREPSTAIIHDLCIQSLCRSMSFVAPTATLLSQRSDAKEPVADVCSPAFKCSYAALSAAARSSRRY